MPSIFAPNNVAELMNESTIGAVGDCDPNGYDLWLDLGMTNVEAASELLKPYDARLMRCLPVSTRGASATEYIRRYTNGTQQHKPLDVGRS